MFKLFLRYFNRLLALYLVALTGFVFEQPWVAFIGGALVGIWIINSED